MDTVYLDGKDSSLYMRFQKVMRSAQGMDIWGSRAYILYDTGVCAVYDLEAGDGEALAQFPLGSYNAGTPTKDYLNHANSCMFSNIHYQGNPIPLLYVTIGTGIGTDEDGYFYRCAVENIVAETDEQGNEHYSAQTIQVISYKPEGDLKAPFEAPCWGCPAFFVDPEEPAMYILSARYRTKRGCVPEGEHNAYIITKFPMPKLEDGPMIHLRPEDILDQFSVESDVLFTQGGTLWNQKIYYTYGCPKIGYPLAIMVFDLEKKELAAQVGNLDEAFHGEEVECCGIYRGKFLCNTCDGGIYEVKNMLNIGKR